MILYHFTFIHVMRKVNPNNTDPVKDAPAIWTWNGGLRPGPKSMDNWSDEYFDPPPAVWFTNNPRPGGTLARVGEDGQQIEYELRITVAMPPNSKRLVHWASYVTKHVGERWRTRALTEAQFAEVERWYCYFGTVNQSYIRAIDLVMDLKREVPATLVPAHSLGVALPLVPASHLGPAGLSSPGSPLLLGERA
jgi:hypothetical protein